MEIFFDAKSVYDENTYKALSEASWQLFVKRRNMVVAYPVFAAMIVLIGAYLAFGWNTMPEFMRYACFGMIAFVIAVIPISSVTTRLKMTSRAIKDAKKTGHFPLKVRFRFGKDEIRGNVDGQSHENSYDSVDIYAVLGDWRLLFFGQAAYIINKRDLADGKTLRDFDGFMERALGRPPVILKGKGPEVQ